MSTLALTLGAADPGLGPLVVGMVIFGAIGSAIGSSKGRAGIGFVLGAFLGVIGWFLVLVMKPAHVPSCATCGRPRRWIAESNSWGCDRCGARVERESRT